MAIELKIVLKGEESTYTHKELIYDEFSFSDNDPILQMSVQAALKEISFKPTEATFTAKMSWDV